MGEVDYVVLIPVLMLLFLMALFGPTRSVLSWCFAEFWTLCKWIFSMVYTGGHDVLAGVWGAHMVWITNWRIRSAVLPSVRNEKSTRRL